MYLWGWEIGNLCGKVPPGGEIFQIWRDKFFQKIVGLKMMKKYKISDYKGVLKGF